MSGSKTSRLAFRVIPFAAAIVAASGCIERTVTIRTEPDGALIHLNDQEVGRSPVTVPFTYYGDYDIIARKAGYTTLKTHYRLNTPWYELPGIDLVTECLILHTVRDHYDVPVCTLTPASMPSKEDVITRAEEMRQRAQLDKTP